MPTPTIPRKEAVVYISIIRKMKTCTETYVKITHVTYDMSHSSLEILRGAVRQDDRKKLHLNIPHSKFTFLFGPSLPTLIIEKIISLFMNERISWMMLAADKERQRLPNPSASQFTASEDSGVIHQNTPSAISHNCYHKLYGKYKQYLYTEPKQIHS